MTPLYAACRTLGWLFKPTKPKSKSKPVKRVLDNDKGQGKDEEKDEGKEKEEHQESKSPMEEDDEFESEAWLMFV